MSDLRQNINTGDLELSGNDLILVSAIDQVRQDLDQRLKSFSGEWFLALDEGLPYYERILIKNPDLVVIQSLIQETIINTANVQEILEFEITTDKAARSLRVDTRIRALDEVFDYSTLLGGSNG